MDFSEDISTFEKSGKAKKKVLRKILSSSWLLENWLEDFVAAIFGEKIWRDTFFLFGLAAVSKLQIVS